MRNFRLLYDGTAERFGIEIASIVIIILNSFMCVCRNHVRPIGLPRFFSRPEPQRRGLRSHVSRKTGNHTNVSTHLRGNKTLRLELCTVITPACHLYSLRYSHAYNTVVVDPVFSEVRWRYNCPGREIY